MEFREPKDVINRKLFEKLTPEQLSEEINKSVKKLNARMRRIEASGYSGASHSYGRMVNYLRSETGTKRFSSKQTKNQSFTANVETLVQLKHFEEYKIGVKDIKKQISGEIKTIKERTGVELTEKQLLTVNKAMQSYREYSMKSTIADLLPSDSIRSFFTEYNDMTQSDVNHFVTELEKFSTGEYNRLELPTFIDKYDPNYGGAVDFTGSGIAFDPTTNQIYDEWHNKTDAYIDVSTEEVLINGVKYRYNEQGELYEVE